MTSPACLTSGNSFKRKPTTPTKPLNPGHGEHRSTMIYLLRFDRFWWRSALRKLHRLWPSPCHHRESLHPLQLALEIRVHIEWRWQCRGTSFAHTHQECEPRTCTTDFMDTKFTPPIPPARTWLHEEFARIQELHRPRSAFAWNPLPWEPLMQLTFQRSALCARWGAATLHVNSSHSLKRDWNCKNKSHPEIGNGDRTIRRNEDVLFWKRDTISPLSHNLVPQTWWSQSHSPRLHIQIAVAGCHSTKDQGSTRTLDLEWRRWKAKEKQGNALALPLATRACPSNNRTGGGGHQRPPETTVHHHAGRTRRARAVYVFCRIG